MALSFNLPDLDKQFYNFELPLDGEEMTIPSIDDDKCNEIYDPLESDMDIKTNLNPDTPPTSIPPSITTESDVEYSAESESSDTDDDIPQNMRGLHRSKRNKRRIKKSQRKRLMHNNPNPHHNCTQQPNIKYNAKYTKCPWSLINIERQKQSLVTVSILQTFTWTDA